MATIREQVIKTLYEKWAEIKCRKNEITNEMWKLEQIRQKGAEGDGRGGGTGVEGSAGELEEEE